MKRPVIARVELRCAVRFAARDSIRRASLALVGTRSSVETLQERVRALAEQGCSTTQLVVC